MKTNLPLFACSLLLLTSPIDLHAQGTSFSYSGELDDSNQPANGSYDFHFTLYDSSNGSTIVAGPILSSAVAVVNGQFVVTLNFGNAFDGSQRWMGIETRTNDNAAVFTQLTPRVPILPTPYANTAENVSGTVDASQIGGAFHLVPGANGPNLVGGSDNNSIGAGVSGATIAGGGDSNGAANTVNADKGTVSGGAGNTIDNNASAATVAGGQNNNIGSGAASASIAGGDANQVMDNAIDASIGGGQNNSVNSSQATITGGKSNTIADNANNSNVSGGQNNNIQTGAANASIGGGNANQIKSGAMNSVISGGQNNIVNGVGGTISGGAGNTVSALADNATIAGGQLNQANGANTAVGGGTDNIAGGIGATVPGGQDNSAAGANSFAAGKNSKSMHDNSFVWSDGNGGNNFASTAANQFLVHANGGVGINVNNPAQALDVGGSVRANAFIGDGSQLTGVNQVVADDAITTAKLADNAVTQPKIGDGAITTSKLTDGSITMAKLASGSVDATKLAAGAPASGQVLGYNGSALAWTAPSGGDSGAAWLLLGNTGTDPNVNFLGTVDNVALTLRVNNSRALQILPSVDIGPIPAPTFVGGSAANQVIYNSSLFEIPGDTISGGGLPKMPNLIVSTAAGGLSAKFCTISGGVGNVITNTISSLIAGGWQNVIDGTASLGANYLTIGGGYQNRIGPGTAEGDTIAGGYQNSILPSADSFRTARFNVIGGGLQNLNRGYTAVIAGGQNNTNDVNEGGVIGCGWFNWVTNSDYGTIAGGYQNRINTSHESFIGGGHGNVIEYPTADSSLSAIGGGEANRIGGSHSVVGGGGQNTISNAQFAVVGGGQNNVVGDGSAYAMIVGGDDNAVGQNCYDAFAAGHFAKAIHSGAFVWADRSGTDFSSYGQNTFSVRAAGGARIYSGASSGVELAGGSGAWSNLSDRNAKENIRAADADEILNRLTSLPISTWNYKEQGQGVRHLGPMAQDFHAAFGVGEDDRHISTVDADGAAFAAIQGLNQKLEKQMRAQTSALKEKEQEIDQLKASLSQLENTVRKLASQSKQGEL